MFCCTRPSHIGQIVTNICEQQQCIAKSTQLCCGECIKEFHSSHNVTSMKKMMPQLLNSNNERKMLIKTIQALLHLVQEEFSNDEYFRSIVGNSRLDVGNVTQFVKLLLLDLKKRNKQQNKKIRQIQKTLKIKNQQKSSSPGKFLQPNYQSVLIKPQNQYGRISRNYTNAHISNEQCANLQIFSHSLKHPYITLSPSMRSATKSSQAGGYKLAALSCAPIPSELETYFFNVKIIKSSGNIHLGLGIAQIVKQRQYLNCYGAGQGTFLIGQNGNDPLSSILFHHSDNVFNRKQIVGWNFKEGQILGIGIIRQQNIQLISFRKYHITSSGKPETNKPVKQFAMPIWPRNAIGSKLHLVILLQSLNDQVEIIPTDQL